MCQNKYDMWELYTIPYNNAFCYVRQILSLETKPLRIYGLLMYKGGGGGGGLSAILNALIALSRPLSTLRLYHYDTGEILLASSRAEEGRDRPNVKISSRHTLHGRGFQGGGGFGAVRDGSRQQGNERPTPIIDIMVLSIAGATGRAFDTRNNFCLFFCHFFPYTPRGGTLHSTIIHYTPPTRYF